MWNGVMGDWEWNLSQWFVAIEGDWGGNNYTNCFFGELTASAPQPAEMPNFNNIKPHKLLYMFVTYYHSCKHLEIKNSLW